MVDVLKTKTLPGALTSYDLLKTLAIVLMVVDHVGYFFFPDDMWWRIYGRLCVPVWFFLIGYAHTRDIPMLFWVAAAVVTLSMLVSGEHLFPVNIIFTLILARLSVDWLFRHGLRNTDALLGMFFLLFLLSGPTLLLFEYGTLGFLFTFIGALRRRKDDVQAPPWMIWSFIAASAAAFILVQSLLLPSLSAAQLLVFVVGMIAICTLLYHFRPYVFESIDAKRFAPVVLLQLTGRRTLEIFVLHLLMLRAAALVLEPDRFSFLSFKIFAHPGLQAFFT